MTNAAAVSRSETNGHSPPASASSLFAPFVALPSTTPLSTRVATDGVSLFLPTPPSFFRVGRRYRLVGLGVSEEKGSAISMTRRQSAAMLSLSLPFIR